MGDSVLKKIKRVASIIIVSTVVFLLGLNIRPSQHQADAKVFDTLLSYTKAMPDYLFEQQNSARPRKVNVNGINTYITVQQSDDDIDDIMDFYAGQYQAVVLDPQVLKAVEAFASDLPADEAAKALKALKRTLGTRQIRHQDEKFGVWGAFEFRNAAQMSLNCKFIQSLNDALKNGNIGKIGIFKVTIALRMGQNGKTRIVNMWTDEDLNLKNLHPDGTGDMPGEDIENVSRFAGAVRQLSIAQENLKTLDRVVVYASDGSILNHILYYHSMMANEGWHDDSSFEISAKDQSRGNVMLYKRKERECTISIDQDLDSGKIITTIMDRKLISG